MSGQGDTGAGPIIVVIVVLVLTILAYNVDEVVRAWRRLDLWQLSLMSALPIVGEDHEALRRALLLIPPEKTTWSMLGYVDRRMGLYLAPPVSVFLFIMAWRGWRARRVRSTRRVTIPLFRKIMGYADIAEFERQAWTPEEWLRFYQIDPDAPDFERRASAALARQLGAPSMAPWARALLVEFAKGVNVLDVLERAIAAHGYASTALLRLAAIARERRGVVSMRFMRPRLQKNRDTLPWWFALASLGRQTAFAEGAGIVAHYRAEMERGQAIREPQVDSAVGGLREYIEKKSEMVRNT